jgi:hypothetical protein
VPQNRRRSVALLLASCFALVSLAAIAAPASAATTDLRINEVESSGGSPGDWVELVNTGSTPVDADGGSASVVVDGIDIDRTGPAVRITGVKGGKTYRNPPTPRCKASDALSGLASCLLDKTRIDKRVTVVVTAIDLAGNVSRDKVTFRRR